MNRTIRRRLAVGASAAALVLTGAVASAPTASAAGRCVDYQYSNGGYSGCVGYIQRLVNWHQRYTGNVPLVVDNAFGPKTRNAVINLQYRYGLQVDGIVGPQTWSLLCYPQAGPGPIPGFPYDTARAAGCAI